MTPEDAKQDRTALEIFHHVREILDVGSRAQILDEACGGDEALKARVAALLSHSVGAGVSAAPAADPDSVATLITSPVEQQGEHIGHYKLLQQIGEGGFGTVWLAEQIEPVRRRVALKIIKPGMDTKEVIARFEQERQALAMMDHSNIAKVFDAGTTPAWRPFFVMELVKGMPITNYCDEAGLGTRERLALFGDVCSAINHAHQKGVIHRDIKPSNVMVTIHGDKPVVKVIDFGIAKATQGKLTDKTIFTRCEQFVGTPVYMSPEQAGMSGLDVDTRSDIYALGVLLYELLTGKPPFDEKSLASAGYEEMRRIIREVEPLKPSSRLSTVAGEERLTLAKARHIEPGKVGRLVEPDLDWIVMKAIEKDRTRRYETANAFAKDIKRFLDHEPVDAGPPSAIYRLRKFARRHRGPLAAASGMVALLVVGVVVSTWQAVKASAAEKRATQKTTDEKVAREDAEAVSKFLSEVFQSPDPARGGRTITVAETLDRAVKKLETDLADQPERRAKLRGVLGSTYYSLGLFREAIPVVEKVRDHYLEFLGPNHPDTVRAMHSLANSYWYAGRRDEARKMREEVLALSRKVSGPEHSDTLVAMGSLAHCYADAGRRDEALKLREAVVAGSRKVNGPEHPNTRYAMNQLAHSYADAGHRDEALKLREEVLAGSRKVNGPEHPSTLYAMHDVALSYFDAGRRDEALKLQEEVLALSRKVFGPKEPLTLMSMSNLAHLYSNAGRRDEAIKLGEEALALRREVIGPEHPDTLTSIHNLAASYGNAGRLDEALRLQEEVLALSARVKGPEHPETLGAMLNVAVSYFDAGRWDDALRLQVQVVALERKVNGPAHPETLQAAINLAAFYRETKRLPEAEKVADELLASLDEGSHPHEFAAALRQRGELRVRMRRWKDAAADYARAAPLNPGDHMVWYQLAPLLLHVGDAEGYREHRQALLEEFRTTDDVPTMERTAKACLLLPVEGEALEAAGRLAEAAVTLGKEHEFRSYFQFTGGLAQYRRGKFIEAVSTLRGVLADPVYVALEIHVHTALAMALHRLNQPAEARAAFAKASELIATKLPSLDSGEPGGTDWHDTLIAHILLHEARALLDEK